VACHNIEKCKFKVGEKLTVVPLGDELKSNRETSIGTQALRAPALRKKIIIIVIIIIIIIIHKI
jgi:hypothetical protein